MKKIWKQLKAPVSPRREEGVVLVIALLLLVMLTVVGLVAIISSSTETAIATNAKGSTQALYLAEAGVSQVAWWFKNPGSFNLGAYINTTPVPGIITPTATTFFEPRAQQGGSYLQSSAVPVTPTQFTGTYANPDLLMNTANAEADLNAIFTSLAGTGRITELRVFAPTVNGNICTVRVTAVSGLGGSRTIEQELAPNLFAGLNAPLQSGLGAAWNGNGTIHWGDVLVQGNANLQNNLNQARYLYRNAQLDKASINRNSVYDRWFNARISGTFAGQGANPSDAPYSTTCVDNPDGTPPYSQICHNNLLQRQTINIQKWEYKTMKDFAQQNGSYYVYYGGDVHRGGPSGPTVDVNTLMIQNNGFVFVDTPNQTDPAAGGTPFTLNQSGNPGGTISGAFYVAGNLSFGGLGGGTNVEAQAPPNPPCTADAGLGPCTNNPTNPPDYREMSDLNVNIKGVLYTTGMLDFQGSPVVFGAAVAEGGFGQGGTPDIYYDWNVRSGRLDNVNPTRKKVWREVRTD